MHIHIHTYVHIRNCPKQAEQRVGRVCMYVNMYVCEHVCMYVSVNKNYIIY